MTPSKYQRRSAAGGLAVAATLFLTNTTHAATFLFSDVRNWIGPAAGPGISQAVMVVQWPGQPAWAWGFRWNSSETRHGRDLLLALAGADPRFTFTGGGFVTNLEWDADQNGTPEFTFPGYNGGTGEYLGYWVNNDQVPGLFSNGAAPAGSHILPPLGSPYDEAGPGRWVSSDTGVLGRPVVDGAWDGWLYSSGDGTVLPGFPLNAPAPIPEPGAAALIVLTGSLLLRRRR